MTVSTWSDEEANRLVATLHAQGVNRDIALEIYATRQLGLGYRESSLTRETRPEPGPVQAGDRAPDARADGVRLFDAFRGPHWTLLTVGTDTELPSLPVP